MRALCGTVLLAAGFGVAAMLALPGPVAAAAPETAVPAATLFSEKGCAHCHGVDRMGTARGPKVMDLRRKTGELETQIRDGGKAMPAFKDSLTPAEIHALAKYVQHLRHWWF